MNKNVKSIDELAEDLSSEQQQILEQFRKDITEHPVRELLPKEKEIYASGVMKAIEMVPSFRDALAVLSPFMDATSSTAYTDKYARVGLSYWFFYLADRNTRAVALLHESMHVLYNHFSRFGNLNITPMKGNISGDLEINSNLSMLPKAKTILQDFMLPDNPSMNFPYFKTMEQYYELINDKLEEDKKESEESGSDDSQTDNSSSSGEDSSSGGSAPSSSSSAGSESGSSQSDGDSNGEGGSQSSSGGSSGKSQNSSSSNGSNGSPKGGSQSSSSDQSSNSGSAASSEYGNSYDDYVRKASGQKPLGTPSLEDMMQDNNQSQQQYSDQNSSGDGADGEDGSGDGASNGSDDVDTSKGSFDDVQKSNKSSGRGKVPRKPSYRCDHSTPERMSAADDAGIEKKSTTSQNIARRNTKARIVEDSKNRSAGNGSSNDFLKIAAALMNPPKVDWRTVFRKVLSTNLNNSVAGKSYHSYKRVNRRSPGSMIFPGMVDYRPTAMLGLDTSGSMGKSDFESLISEIEGIMKKGMRSNRSLKTFCVDTEIKGIELVNSVKDLKLTGGGGTEMSVAFSFVNSLPKKEKPDIFVLGTDGGLWVEDWKRMYNLISQASYKTIILITSEGGFEGVPRYIHQVASVVDVSESQKKMPSF